MPHLNSTYNFSKTSIKLNLFTLPVMYKAIENITRIKVNVRNQMTIKVIKTEISNNIFWVRNESGTLSNVLWKLKYSSISRWGLGDKFWKMIFSKVLYMNSKVIEYIDLSQTPRVMESWNFMSFQNVSHLPITPLTGWSNSSNINLSMGKKVRRFMKD